MSANALHRFISRKEDDMTTQQLQVSTKLLASAAIGVRRVGMVGMSVLAAMALGADSGQISARPASGTPTVTWWRRAWQCAA